MDMDFFIDRDDLSLIENFDLLNRLLDSEDFVEFDFFLDDALALLEKMQNEINFRFRAQANK